MKKTNMDLIVGGSILIALLILITSVLWLKEVNVSRKKVEYTVLFPNIGTLQLGDPVMVNGVKKGVVADISLQGDSVAVVCKIDESVVLTDSSRVTVQNIGIMGERMIGIQLSSKGTPYEPDKKSGKPSQYIPGHFDSGIAEAMGMIGTVLGEVEVLVNNVESIVNETIGDTTFIVVFDEILGRLDEISKFGHALVSENKKEIERSINNLYVVSDEIREIIAENKGDINKLVKNGAQLSDQALVIADGIDSISTSVQVMLTDIESGNSALGKMLADDAFYDDVKQSVDELDNLVKEVREDGLKLRIGFRKKRDKNKE
ncbi:MAG: MCE family protein [Chitinivibrionales bacterium]|nr:MCE family protein [Chitinivibrionales bacterium]